MSELRTIGRIIEVLGDGDKQAGRRELMRLTGRRPQHVTNWLAAGTLPKWCWLIVSHALEQRGYWIRPGLCGLERPQEQAEAS
ncbi:MAG TPA: hypothetical protein VF748_07520 [Candidatus Acidoferrum sp.]